jgi:hypothetical protein
MTSQLYLEKLKDPRWQKRRLQILERDNWTCQFCGNTKEMLVAHHKDYISGLEIWEYPDNYLISLCESCHNREFIRNTVEKSLIQNLRLNFSVLDISLMDEIIACCSDNLSPQDIFKIVHIFRRCCYEKDYRDNLLSKWDTQKDNRWQEALNDNIKTFNDIWMKECGRSYNA